MRIPTLIQKIKTLADQDEAPGIIDVDLMLDYTRVLYADLLEWRERLTAAAGLAVARMPEPTLDELTQAMFEREAAEEDFEEDGQEEEVIQTTVVTRTEAVEEKVEEPGVTYQESEETRDLMQEDAATVFVNEEIASGPSVLNIAEFPSLPTRDIRTLISINDKYQFMSALFGNDKAGYEAALDQINLSENFESAQKWLLEQLWVAEEYEDLAQEFFEIIRKFKTIL